MTTENEFEDLIDLLPFYVNGTLSSYDRARMDDALSISKDLRDELAVHKALGRAVKQGGNELTQGDDNTEANLKAVLDRLEDHAPDRQTVSVPKPQGFAQMLGFLHPKRWHPVVALSMALAISAQAAVIANLNTDKERGAVQMAALERRLGELEFQLASGPGGEGAKGSVIVQLEGEASWSDVSALLTGEGLSILSGPSDDTLTLFSTAKGAALDAQIARLKTSKLVASADKAA